MPSSSPPSSSHSSSIFSPPRVLLGILSERIVLVLNVFVRQLLMFRWCLGFFCGVRIWFFVYRLVCSVGSSICVAVMLVFGFVVFGVMYAQQRLGVLWAAPIVPFVSTAMRPMLFFMWRRWFTSVMAFSAAFCAVFPVAIWSQVYLARTKRMATSPMPVALQAPVWLSA